MKEITDEQAIALIQEEQGRGVFQAKIFVPRTIWHTVSSFDSKGNENMRIQPFLTQGSYCSEIEWEQALEFEKKFTKLNKVKREQFGEVGNMPEIKDPLKTKILDVR